jgi:AI-2 transport protein TqsA
VNMLIGNLLEPALMGRRLGLSTLVVLISLVFWGWVWGLAGMLLSLPLTMAVKIALEGTSDFRWVAVLLGPAAPAAIPPGASGLAVPIPPQVGDAGEPPALPLGSRMDG